MSQRRLDARARRPRRRHILVSATTPLGPTVTISLRIARNAPETKARHEFMAQARRLSRHYGINSTPGSGTA